MSDDLDKELLRESPLTEILNHWQTNRGIFLTAEELLTEWRGLTYQSKGNVAIPLWSRRHPFPFLSISEIQKHLWFLGPELEALLNVDVWRNERGLHWRFPP